MNVLAVCLFIKVNGVLQTVYGKPSDIITVTYYFKSK